MINEALILFRSFDPAIYIYLSVFLVAVFFLFLILSKPKEKTKSSLAEKNQPQQTTLIKSLAEGMSKTRSLLSGSLESLFQSKSKLDAHLLDSVYETLYKSDMGASTTEKLVRHLKEASSKRETCDSQFVKNCLSEKVLEILEQVSFKENSEIKSPHIILVVGVNGAGKTTTIGKMASKFKDEGKVVALCGGDTYRAAAIDQLKIWGERLGIKVFFQKEGSDPAAVAFDASKAASSREIDVLIIDTAGRLQNKKDLMEELSKVKRAIAKGAPGAPHETILVLDSTMGQNALIQVSAFKEFVDLTSLIVTKLDGTAKGGVLVALAEKFALPVRFIGVGETAADLKPFVAKDYVKAILS